MRRSLLTAIAATVLVTVWSAPAWAHAKFPSAAAYPSGTDQRLTLHVPDERGDATHSTGIKVFVPAGWSATACEAAAPWRCAVAPGPADGQDVVEWTRDTGAAPGPADETFVFSVHTGPPGTVSFPMHQTYGSGEVVRWIGPAGGDEPAPSLEAVAAAPSATTTAGPAATTTTSAPATSTTTGPPGTATTLAAPPREPTSSGDSNPAVLVVPVLLAAAIAGGLLRWRAGRT
ncbi:MAG: DUF1775 domain-containing protein [Acidimicrobiia bacterium]